MDGQVTERVRKRFRWPWLAIAAVLLVAGGPVAWRLRPLTETERKLLGTWLWQEAKMEFTFTADRRFSRQVYGSSLQQGNWSASNGKVFFHSIDDTTPVTTSTISFHLRRLLRSEPPSGRDVEFLPRNQMLWTRRLDASKIYLIRLQ